MENIIEYPVYNSFEEAKEKFKSSTSIYEEEKMLKLASVQSSVSGYLAIAGRSNRVDRRIEFFKIVGDEKLYSIFDLDGFISYDTFDAFLDKYSNRIKYDILPEFIIYQYIRKGQKAAFELLEKNFLKVSKGNNTFTNIVFYSNVEHPYLIDIYSKFIAKYQDKPEFFRSYTRNHITSFISGMINTTRKNNIKLPKSTVLLLRKLLLDKDYPRANSGIYENLYEEFNKIKIYKRKKNSNTEIITEYITNLMTIIESNIESMRYIIDDLNRSWDWNRDDTLLVYMKTYNNDYLENLLVKYFNEKYSETRKISGFSNEVDVLIRKNIITMDTLLGKLSQKLDAELLKSIM